MFSSSVTRARAYQQPFHGQTHCRTEATALRHGADSRGSKFMLGELRFRALHTHTRASYTHTPPPPVPCARRRPPRVIPVPPPPPPAAGRPRPRPRAIQAVRGDDADAKRPDGRRRRRSRTYRKSAVNIHRL